MSRIRSANTRPEMILRRYLHKSGFRYRINYPLFGKPDIVFPKNKVAIFINGCFWHQHGCKNSVIPKTNTKFWKDKLGKNIDRDKAVLKELKDKKWFVKRIWECEIENNLHQVVNLLVDSLDKSGIKLTKE